MKKTLTNLLSIYMVITCINPVKSQLVNKGKIYIANTSSSGISMLINSNLITIDDSEIFQNGKVVLKNDFINNVSANNVIVPLEKGVFEFCGNKAQHIRGTADKENNYINFPDLVINNQTKIKNEDADTSAVIVGAGMAINARNVILQRGRLILESDTTEAGKSHIAHLIVENAVNYPTDNEERQPEEKSLIQVNLALGKNHEKGGLIGFTPPFGKIYADYFFYNFISTPFNTNAFNNISLMNSPKDPLVSGRGYIIGFGLVPDGSSYYTEHLDARWSNAKFTDRVTEKLMLARDFAPRSLTQFVNNDGKIKDAFDGEKIITEDVSIRLEEGWNYVGNPFTAPLDMTSFIDPGVYVDEWGVTRGGENAMVLSKYYMLHDGTGKYVTTGSTGKFIFNSSFHVIQKEAQTGDPEPFLSPMQMFVIKKNPKTPGGSLVIPKSKRAHSKAAYLRGSETKHINEILIETTDLQTGGYDRVCIAFRSNSSLKSNDFYDAEKIFNNSGGVNQLYTLSSDNKKMTSNVIPVETKEFALYFQPSSIEQQVVLRATRLESFTAAATIRLEDKKTGLITDLYKKPEYVFTSSPTDKTDRFILHFSDITVGSEVVINKPGIKIHYNPGKLTVSDLEVDDEGKSIIIYDIAGQVVFKRKLTGTPICDFNISLATGVYVAKINRDKPIMQKIYVN